MAAQPQRIPPRWAAPVTLVLSLLGLGVAIYLTYEHYTGNATLVCHDNGVINCGKVTTSPESVVFGIPVAVLGLAFFVSNLAIMSPWAWRDPRTKWIRLGSVIVGLGFVAYLVSAELFKIHAICLWCSSVHVVTLLIFLATIFAYAFAEEPELVS